MFDKIMWSAAPTGNADADQCGTVLPPAFPHVLNHSVHIFSRRIEVVYDVGNRSVVRDRRSWHTISVPCLPLSIWERSGQRDTHVKRCYIQSETLPQAGVCRRDSDWDVFRTSVK